jgi:hypothetical protein
MAALALIGASSILIGRGLSAQGAGRAQEASPSKSAKTPSAKSFPDPGRGEPQGPDSRLQKGRDAGPSLPVVELDLAIAGLGSQGCDVEVKPANPSCKFRPSPTKHVSSDGHAKIELKDVELRGADKTCAVAITVREPGQPPQTIYRGFRTSTSKAGAIPSFKCFISSRLAGVDTKPMRK